MKIDWNNTILYSRTRLVILLPMATAILTHQCQIELADNVEKEWVWLSTCANILSCHYLFRTFVRNAFVCCHIPAYSKHGFDNLMFMSTNQNISSWIWWNCSYLHVELSLFYIHLLFAMLLVKACYEITFKNVLNICSYIVLAISIKIVLFYL